MEWVNDGVVLRESNQVHDVQKRFTTNRRVLRFETLESKTLLSAAKGIAAAEWADIADQYSGFDFSGISADSVFVIEPAQISAASLREAVARAKSSFGADLIVIHTSETSDTLRFSSTSQMFTIDDISPLTILAYGPKRLAIDAENHSRIFNIAAASKVQLGNMILTGGSSDRGGAVKNDGHLVLDRMHITCNTASAEGGGIFSSNSLAAINSVISGNTANGHGGGVCSRGIFTSENEMFHVTLTGCTVTGNRAGLDGIGKGGGVYFSGQDAEYNIHSDLVIHNCILVENRSAATQIDANIYNSVFYNELILDGELYSFEIPVAALIDGNNNLSTFTYWVSWHDPDHPDSVGENQIYNESIPLFVRHYDFGTNTEGDYTLYETGLSQAVNQGSNETAVYPNGMPIVLDGLNRRRIQNGRVDIGAFELTPTKFDIATDNTGRLSDGRTVAGGAVQINSIVIKNQSEIDAEDVRIRFFASDDPVIDELDVPIGEMVVDFLSKQERRTLNSDRLQTGALRCGQTYYIGWIIDFTNDTDLSNNAAVCQTTLQLFNEHEPAQTVELEQSAYHVQQGCVFRLSTAPPSSMSVQYWWDYGNGYYTKGAPSVRVNTSKYYQTPGNYEIRLKIVDEKSNSVIQKAYSSLTVAKLAPCISVDKTTYLNERILKLDIDVYSYGPIAERWIIDWGDGSEPVTYGSLSGSLSVVHCFDIPRQTTTFSITLRIITAEDTDNDNDHSVYFIGFHAVNAIASNSGELTATAAEASVPTSSNESDAEGKAAVSTLTQAAERINTAAHPFLFRHTVESVQITSSSANDVTPSFITYSSYKTRPYSPYCFSSIFCRTLTPGVLADRILEDIDIEYFKIFDSLSAGLEPIL